MEALAEEVIVNVVDVDCVIVVDMIETVELLGAVELVERVDPGKETDEIWVPEVADIVGFEFDADIVD